jgi:LPXTG-site transpeptidase (sortase) family protein
MRRWRLLAALTGVALIAVSSIALLWPVLVVSPPSPRTAELQKLPQPMQIIDPAEYPAPLPVGDQKIARDPPGAPDGWRIRLPALNIDLPLVQGDGRSVPYYKAAHYPTMPWPGEGQRSFIYAHAQYGPPIMFGPLLGHSAPFYTGMDIYVDRGGRSALHYVIKQYYPAWSPSDARWLQPADGDQLILMTCTGWNAGDPRVIVVALPAEL